MRTTAWILIVIAMIAALPLVSAEITSPTALTRGSSSTRDLSGLATQNTVAQGGNVTQLDIDALKITDRWQGFYGNIYGEVALENAGGNTFYNWTLTNVSGEVYATRNETADFTTIGCAGAAERASEETYLNQTKSDSDSVTNTFNSTSHDTFDAGSVSGISGCYATNAHTNTGVDSASFQQVLLADGAGSIVYTTIIDNDETGFDGGTYDFEILVGEDQSTSGQSGSTAYYFFVELN